MKTELQKILFATLLIGFIFPAQAQLTKEQLKERKEMAKMTKSELNSRSSKAARKEAKRLKKEGWQVAPGALPLDKQLDRSYNMQYEFDENQMPKYIMGEAMSIAENYDAAKTQAMELAKQNLAGQIQTEVTALVENTVANQQLAAEQAASITKTISASKNLISQSLGRTIPVVEVYRVKNNKNKEVMVRIAYSTTAAIQTTKKIIREELEKKGEDLHEQLDNLLGICN